MTESISQLEMQIEALRNKIALKKEEQREEALLKVTEILREYGLKLEDIMTVRIRKNKKLKQNIVLNQTSGLVGGEHQSG